MRKLIFILILTIFVPLFLNAQDNTGMDNIKNGVNNQILKSAYSMQELNSKLLDAYGMQNIEFVKLEDGKYVPIKENQVKELEGKNIQEAQISSDVILIFAIIGAVLVGLLILRSL